MLDPLGEAYAYATAAAAAAAARSNSAGGIAHTHTSRQEKTIMDATVPVRGAVCGVTVRQSPDGLQHPAILRFQQVQARW